jgi:hypothetical protein
MGTDTSFSLVAVSEVHGRTFGTWTLLTCTLCYICAFNLDNKPLYLATFLSFIYAFGHFLTEYLIYHTMAISNLTTVGIFAGMMNFILVSHQFVYYIALFSLILNQITVFFTNDSIFCVICLIWCSWVPSELLDLVPIWIH